MSTPPVQRDLVIDTNLLLVYLVGEVDAGLIPGWKRTANYAVSDYGLIKSVIARSRQVYCTPHSLAEVSNFISQAYPEIRLKVFAALTTALTQWIEVYTPSRVLTESPELAYYGLTDLSLLSVCREKSASGFTADAKLGHLLNLSEVEYVNLNHIRNFD